MIDTKKRVFGRWRWIVGVIGMLGLFLAVASDVVAGELLAKRVVLDNGLTLLVSEKQALPIVTVQVLIKAGSVLELKDKAGLANLAAELLTRGTKTRSALEISGAIEFVGGSLASWGGADSAPASLTVLKKDLDLGLDLLADILLNPVFAEEEIQRKVKETLAAIRKKQEEPGVVAEEALDTLVFGDHPYGRPVEGAEESLPRITRTDLQTFHATSYRPERTIVAVVGDVGVEEIVAKFKARFGAWRRGDVPEPVLLSPPPLDGLKVKKINKDLTQANIALGHLGISRGNPDYYAVQVMNYILGSGGFASRLMTNIREEKGWAYDIDSTFVARLQP
ncbi:MAG: insulinase family protein, partial [candidate division NC10 bacterium]|nr:insulinase family protein [candidate division NC10 bacterium]